MQEEQKEQLTIIIGNKPYKPISKLSYGAYGEIFKIFGTKDQKQYVAKVISKQKMVKEKKLHQAVIQGYLLSRFKHPNIIKYFNTLETKQYLCQILQYCPYGDFFNLMKKVNKSIEMLQRKGQIVCFYLAQIIQALSYLHEQKIVHRDIKPENLVIAEDFHLRLIDFGTAKALDPSIMYNKKQMELLEHLKQANQQVIENQQQIARRGSFVGSANYISPESISMNHSLASDVWSFGVIVYKIYHNRLPFEQHSNFLVFQKIKDVKYELDSELSDEVKDLITICLKKNPEERPTIQELKKHKYFEKIEFQKLFEVKPPLTEKDLRMTEVQLKPIKQTKMEIVLEKQMFFGNYKPRILKMYDRDQKLYMSYWYLDKDVPKNQFEIRITDYAQVISKNEFQVRNDDVKYTFRVGEKHQVNEVVEEINQIIRNFYDLG